MSDQNNKVLLCLEIVIDSCNISASYRIYRKSHNPTSLQLEVHVVNIFLKNKLQSNLSMQPPLLSSHLY